MNSQIYSRTGGFMGLSFAIPVEVVMNVYHQIVAKGKVSRGWLGVLIQEVTRELAESFGMARPHGALVAKVLPDSPAAEAGIQPGDVVVEFNGIEIDLSSDLPPLVGNTEVGKKVPLKLIREGDPSGGGHCRRGASARRRVEVGVLGSRYTGRNRGQSFEDRSERSFRQAT